MADQTLAEGLTLAGDLTGAADQTLAEGLTAAADSIVQADRSVVADPSAAAVLSVAAGLLLAAAQIAAALRCVEEDRSALVDRSVVAALSDWVRSAAQNAAPAVVRISLKAPRAQNASTVPAVPRAVREVRQSTVTSCRTVARLTDGNFRCAHGAHEIASPPHPLAKPDEQLFPAHSLVFRSVGQTAKAHQLDFQA